MRFRLGQHRCGGFTLVELLIALVIGAILLVAVGMAIAAATSGIQANQDLNTAIKTSRLALSRLTADVRQSQFCQVGTGPQTDGSGKPVAGSVQYPMLYLTQPDGTKLSVVYYNQQLLLDTQAWSTFSNSPNVTSLVSRMPGNTSTPTVFLLASNISLKSSTDNSEGFIGVYKTKDSSKSTGSSGNAELYLASVQIEAIVTVGKQKLALSDAVAIQRDVPLR